MIQIAVVGGIHISLPVEQVIYEMPIQPVICIGASVTTTSGAGNLQFSIDSEEKLNDGSAVFASWDGVADINTAVTGFRLVATSGLLTAAVAVKTTQAS